MNKLKVLLMLLLTMFLFESTTLKSYAAITDMKETPDEYSLTESDDFYSNHKYLTRIEINKEDEGKMQKIIIPKYSYFELCSSAGEVSMYTDSEKKNKLIESNIISLFLPKGDYFLCLEKCNELPEGLDDEDLLYFLYGRVSVKTIIVDSVVKGSKYYDISRNGWPGFHSAKGFMAGDSKHFCYGTTYTITSSSCGNDGLSDKYNFITYQLCVNSKDSKVKATPTGSTKKIINAEKTGEEVSDTKKKDKKKPTVKGVKNNKTYKKTVKIKVSDKSGIKKVTLNGKKMKVSKFKKGYKIIRKKSTKKYVLKVWDKAGNKQVVKFKIKKK